MRISLSDREIVCIDWDERSLRLVAAEVARGAVRVRAAAHVPIEPEVNVREPAALGGFLRRSMAANRIRGRRAMVDIARHEVVLNRMALPPGTTDELAAMVHMQIGKELPFAKDQAVIDFALPARPSADGMLEVWVAAVRSSAVQYYRQVIEAAGLRLERLGLRPFANACGLRVGGELPGRTLMIDIGPSVTEIGVLRDGHLAYSRSAAVAVPPAGLWSGGEAPSPPARGDSTIPLSDEMATRPRPLDVLLVEVNRTIAAYRATDLGATIDRIVLAGTVGVDESVARAFENRFGAPAGLYEVPESLRWRGAGVPIVAFSAVIGLAAASTADPRQHFDFSHPKEPEAERRERIRKRPLVAVVAGLFIAAGAVAAWQPFALRKAELARLNAQIRLLNEDEAARKDMLRKVAELKDWQKRNISWLDMLLALSEALPSNEQSHLTELEFYDTGRAVARLVALDQRVVTGLVEAINRVKTPGGEPMFRAAAGSKAGPSRDEKYVVSDEVVIEIPSMVPKKKGK